MARTGHSSGPVSVVRSGNDAEVAEARRFYHSQFSVDVAIGREARDLCTPRDRDSRRRSPGSDNIGPRDVEIVGRRRRKSSNARPTGRRHIDVHLNLLGRNIDTSNLPGAVRHHQGAANSQRTTRENNIGGSADTRRIHIHIGIHLAPHIRNRLVKVQATRKFVG